jgi:hypothetical protein
LFDTVFRLRNGDRHRIDPGRHNAPGHHHCKALDKTAGTPYD